MKSHTCQNFDQVGHPTSPFKETGTCSGEICLVRLEKFWVLRVSDQDSP